MKKTFEFPEIEVVKFETEAVLSTDGSMPNWEDNQPGGSLGGWQ